MLRKLFVEHPESVGESYFQHMGVAFGFGFHMLGAALACIIHGLVPGLFVKTGSKAIICLHTRLMSNTCRAAILSADAAGGQPIASQAEPRLNA